MAAAREAALDADPVGWEGQKVPQYVNGWFRQDPRPLPTETGVDLRSPEVWAVLQSPSPVGSWREWGQFLCTVSTPFPLLFPFFPFALLT